MGWWSETVMGGDTPLDCLGWLAKNFGVEYGSGDFYGYGFSREALESPNSSADNISAANQDCFHNPVFGQVVGAVYLHVGAAMSDMLKEFVITCAEHDEWAQTDKTRKAYMQELIEKVKAHKAGTQTELAKESLLDRVARLKK